MRVLSKTFKYKQEIFDAIFTVFSESKNKDIEDEISYREIWRRINGVLGYRVYFRDFQTHIEYMEYEKILERNDPSEGRRGAKVYFSLTKKAEQLYALKILGIDKSIQKRKKLYQLLISFEVFKRRNPITQRQLYQFLKQIRTSGKSLEIVKVTDKITHFKLVKGVKIIKWIQSGSIIGPNASVYHISIPGFTAKEFTSYLTRLKKGKEPRPFPYYAGITDVPFVLDTDYAESEITDAIESFRKDGLIKPINDVFPGEMRYDLADEYLTNFIKDVWLVHDLDLRLLFERLVYEGRPKEKDISYLKFMYGKRIADRILANAYHIKQANKSRENREEEKKAKRFIQALEKHRRSLIEDVGKRHENVIRNYEIASRLVEGICFSPFVPRQN